jgi:hypothetical protein
MKLPLKHPIVVSDKVTISELNFRDHTIAADYLAFDVRGGVAQRIALIANIAGTEEAVVKRMNGIDYRRAEMIVDKLMADDEAQSADSDADALKQSEKK